MSTASGSGRRKPSRSTIFADNAGGYHDFVIKGYSRIKKLPTGDCLKSSPFTAGGHPWRISFYPNGANDDSEGYVSLFLYLNEDITGRVKAQFDFAFMAEKRAPFFRKRMEKVITKPALVNRFHGHSGYGLPHFVRSNSVDLEKLVSKSDSLTIRCGVVVFDDLRPEQTTAKATTPTTFVPPSNLHRHFGNLLQTGKGADVVFQVDGDKFPAHRCVLAARSPVFNAKIIGTMQESTITTTASVVRIDDMVAPVFKALLYFLYNIKRLKMICEGKPSKNIDEPKVATILTLAEQHKCHVLKKLCLDFLSTPANLKAVMATGGFKHLSTSCPSMKKDLDAMLAS
ncbi:hypothetical protein QOZ80_2AG0124640 [Eleusine coracana subsp. coracana]|nr:hypothetical protein QOZ80_2AG0124640 [Eleusine coracana subsp. coracana]